MEVKAMNESMLDRLVSMENRYEELGHMLMDPDIGTDIKKMTDVTKEQASLQAAYDLFQEYKEVNDGIDGAKELMKENDPEIKEMAKMELDELEERMPDIIKKLELELIPKDPNDNKNVIMEIRGAAGGDEGNIFAGDLYRMYVKYAESQGWKVEVMEAEESEAGGFSLISFNVIGDGVYGKLKYESGSHRVQRVPKTETQGRVHTSTATVLVMPEMEEVDVQINKSDLRIDTYRASGAGGQHINKTDSAVRITHLPTGIVATSQDGRSQHDNRDKAMKALVARVYDYFQSQQTEAIDSERKSKVGTGDRAEKIRTYNYPQNRVTDHRIGLTIQQLDRIIEGKLDDIITALINEDQRLKLEGQK
jgi:peptide chain release factor 1